MKNAKTTCPNLTFQYEITIRNFIEVEYLFLYSSENLSTNFEEEFYQTAKFVSVFYFVSLSILLENLISF